MTSPETALGPGVADALLRQNGSLRQVIAVVDRLTAIALEGANVERITEELSAAIGCEVAVFDPLLRPLAASSGVATTGAAAALRDPRYHGVLESAQARRLPLRIRAMPPLGIPSDVVVVPIAVGAQVFGYLVVAPVAEGRDEEDLELLTVQHAASIYALSLVESQRDAALRSRYRAELLESLLLGRFDRENAGELARLAGLRTDEPLLVVAIAPAGRGSDRDAAASVLDALATDLDQLDDGVVALARADQVVVVAPATLADGVASAHRISEHVRRRFPAVAFAFGGSSVVSDPAQLGRADTQARRALAIATRLGALGEVLSHEDLGVHRLLLHVPDDELRAFADDVLGGLAEHDLTQRSSLLETLAAYLDANGNLRRAGEELFVHVNTVSYRVRRIEDLTGLDLSTSADRLLAQLSIEALRALPVPSATEAERPLRGISTTDGA